MADEGKKNTKRTYIVLVLKGAPDDFYRVGSVEATSAEGAMRQVIEADANLPTAGTVVAIPRRNWSQEPYRQHKEEVTSVRLGGADAKPQQAPPSTPA